MSLDDTYREWWATLDGTGRREARSCIGTGVPPHLADSLTRQNIVLVAADVLNGDGQLHPTFLMPTALMAFIEQQSVEA